MNKVYSIKIDLVLADLNYYSRPAESVRTDPENKLCQKRKFIFRTSPVLKINQYFQNRSWKKRPENRLRPEGHSLLNILKTNNTHEYLYALM